MEYNIRLGKKEILMLKQVFLIQYSPTITYFLDMFYPDRTKRYEIVLYKRLYNLQRKGLITIFDNKGRRKGIAITDKGIEVLERKTGIPGIILDAEVEYLNYNCRCTDNGGDYCKYHYLVEVGFKTYYVSVFVREAFPGDNYMYYLIYHPETERWGIWYYDYEDKVFRVENGFALRPEEEERIRMHLDNIALPVFASPQEPPEIEQMLVHEWIEFKKKIREQNKKYGC